jgi:hypothetical protein
MTLKYKIFVISYEWDHETNMERCYLNRLISFPSFDSEKEALDYLEKLADVYRYYCKNVTILPFIEMTEK